MIRREVPGAFEVPERARSRLGRVMDIGNMGEVTFETMSGRMGLDKLNQLWDDLVDNGQIILTVPKLSPGAQEQLEFMLALARDRIDKNCIIMYEKPFQSSRSFKG